jgi:hypothetical protein
VLEAVVPALSEGAVSASEFNLFDVCPSDQRAIVGRDHVSETAIVQPVNVAGIALAVGAGDVSVIDAEQGQSDDVAAPALVVTMMCCAM